MHRITVMFGILFCIVAPAKAADDSPFKCAYYLYEISVSSSGCSGCYIPVLVTRQPLQKDTEVEAAVIITYERDSIWELKSEPAAIKKGAVTDASKHILFDGKKYRFQAVDTLEILKLLKNPMGEIPIHRQKKPDIEQPLGKTLLRDLDSKTQSTKP